jgi:glycosyltransferase involved in cell wall biosynthesis
MHSTLLFASFRFEAIAGRMSLALGVPANPASVDRQPNVSQSGYRVTIGMPLYNNAATIRRALDSLLAQSFTDFHLLISDDRSTDETPAICAEYARCDSRVEIVHQPHNLNYGNFRYVLNAATTPLFMFAAGDDYWHRDYVGRMVEALDTNPDAVCSVSQVAFVKDSEVVELSSGTQALTADRVTNLVRYLEAPNDNSRMYGVFRTEAAQRAFPKGDFHAYDWAFSIGTLLVGKHIEVPEVLMWRDRTDPHRYTEYVRRDAHAPIDRLFPLFPLTRDILGRLRVPINYRLLRALFWLNAESHVEYLRRYHPKVAGPSERFIAGCARAARRMRSLV